MQPNNAQRGNVTSAGRRFYTSAYKICENGVVEVQDLDFAGYLSMLDIPVIKIIAEESPDNRPLRFKVTFKATEDDIVALAVSYANSESARHADSVRRLKKAMHSTPKVLGSF